MNNRLVVVFLLGVGATTLMHGQTSNTKILLTFTGPNGADPTGGLVRDASGNLYGTTSGGGDMSCLPNGCGIVFKLDPSGNEIILHQFTGPDGANPLAGLIRDAADNLYGTTWFGGTFGQGTVFKIDTTGKETVLYSFSGASGANSISPSGLVADPEGNLYGTTSGGGLMPSSGGTLLCSDGCGTVFKIDPSGKETVLYNFKGGTDSSPRSSVTLDAAGNLYGTTYQGGAFGCGTVFKLDTNGRMTVLYTFTGGADGGLPSAAVILDPAGNIYGTTSGGGNGSTGPSTANRGYGTVFKIDTTGKETILYSFTGGIDGWMPTAGVIRDGAGNLYGTTEFGGVPCAVYVVSGCGAVFKLDATGKETTLYAFALPNYGFPVAGLIVDAEGNLYGTAEGGSNGSSGPVLLGAAFEVLGAASPKPVVIIVPGFGASTLANTATGVDQWLSCDSILSLHNGLGDPMGSLASLRYDTNGNAAVALTPTEILMQNDSISNIGRPATQSILQCSNNAAAGADPNVLVNDLLVVDDVACTSVSNVECLALQTEAITGAFTSDIQKQIVSGSTGDFLQFNDPSHSLIGILTANGFDPQAWAYDFRRDISSLADDLYTEVKKVSSNYPGRPVAIVAHSEGSLVAAAMLAQYPDVYPKFLNKIVSMGAPFLGAIDPYLYAQGWERFVPFMSNANTALLGNNWTSVYQVLPQWPFFTPLVPPSPSVSQIVNGQPSVHWPALPRPNALPDSSNPKSVWGEISALTPQSFPNWYAFIGYGHSSNRQIVQTVSDLVNNLIFSKPCSTLQKSDGDGTIPLFSSKAGSMVSPDNMIFVQEEHAQLPKNGSVISGILNILNGMSALSVSGLIPESQVPTFNPLDIITINACSPVAVSVTDSSGETVNSQVSQIQNATYENIADATQIDLPWNDIFQMQITGTGTGTFDLVVNGTGGQHAPLAYIFRAVPVLQGSQGSVSVGGTTVPTLRYNYAGKNVIDTIPANSTPPTILCTGCYFIVQNLRATFAFNVGYAGGVSTFSYNYRSSSQTVQFASTVTSAIASSGNTATFSGQGTLNGQAGYSFTMIAKDGGGPGSGLDYVALTITGPNGYSYSVAATVIGGDIVVHQ